MPTTWPGKAEGKAYKNDLMKMLKNTKNEKNVRKKYMALVPILLTFKGQNNCKTKASNDHKLKSYA